MAKIEFEGLDELIKGMEAEGDRMTRNGPVAVMAGGKAAVEAMKQTAPVRTGGLREHIQIKGPYYNSVDGHYCEVFPSGRDPHGERYETIGFVQEYGRSNMAAQPWMRPVVETQGESVGKAMAEILMSD